MNKSELLNWLQEEYQQWEAFLDQIGPARMEQPGVTGDWSMKDIVAHLTGWNRWLVARLQAAQRGEPEPPPPWPAHLQTDDEINAWIYASNRGRSVREVLDESIRYFSSFSLSLKAYPMTSGSRTASSQRTTLCGWTINASPPVNSLTISMMTMSQTYAPGWRE